MAESQSVEYVDNVFRDYWKFQSATGYDDDHGVGMFAQFAEDNGYGTEEIQDELDADDPEESTLADFIEMDDFPSHIDSDRMKRHYIFTLIRLGKSLADAKKVDTNWTAMTGAFNVYKHHGKLCKMSRTEFAMVCAQDIGQSTKKDEHRTYKHTIWVFDADKNAWRYANDYNSWSPAHGSFAYEYQHDQFYSVNSDKIQIVDGRRPGKRRNYPYKEMQCLNNASKFITHLNPIEDEREMRRNAMFKYWESEAIFEYHNEKFPRMHCMGGRQNACHVKYQPRKDELNWEVTFPRLHWERGCTFLGVVWVKWRQWVICFGGNKSPGKEYPDDISNKIQVYKCSGKDTDKSWVVLRNRMPYPMDDFGCAVDCNERFVVISHRKYGIWRFNLHTGMWQKSTVAPPTEARHSIVILGGKSKDRLAYRQAQAFCNVTAKENRWIGPDGTLIRMPLRVRFIICEYLEEGEEFVHCINLQNGGHWKYPLRDLFLSIEREELTMASDEELAEERRRQREREED